MLVPPGQSSSSQTVLKGTSSSGTQARNDQWDNFMPISWGRSDEKPSDHFSEFAIEKHVRWVGWFTQLKWWFPSSQSVSLPDDELLDFGIEHIKFTPSVARHLPFFFWVSMATGAWPGQRPSNETPKILRKKPPVWSVSEAVAGWKDPENHPVFDPRRHFFFPVAECHFATAEGPWRNWEVVSPQRVTFGFWKRWLSLSNLCITEIYLAMINNNNNTSQDNYRTIKITITITKTIVNVIAIQ